MNLEEDFSTLITTTGDIRIAKMLAGESLELAYFAVGDSNGYYHEPDASQTALVNETWRGTISSVLTDPIDPSLKTFTAYIPATVGGWWIREAGIFTNDNPPLLFAVAKIPAREKVSPDNGASVGIYIKMCLDINSGTITVVPGVEVITDLDIYSPDSGYPRGHNISFLDQVYVALYETVPGQSPISDPDLWQVLPSKGEKGGQGEIGPSGARVGEATSQLEEDIMFASGFSMVIRTDLLQYLVPTTPAPTPTTTPAPTTTPTPTTTKAGTTSGPTTISPSTTASVIAAPTGSNVTAGANSATLNPGVSTGALSYVAYYTTDGSTPSKTNYIGRFTSLVANMNSVMNGLTANVTFKFVFTAFTGTNQTGIESQGSPVYTVTPYTATTGGPTTTGSPTTAGPTTTPAPTTTKAGTTTAPTTTAAPTTTPAPSTTAAPGNVSPTSTITMTLQQLPLAPSILVTPGDSMNTVNWSAVPSAISYNLYWTTNVSLTPAQMKAGFATKISGLTGTSYEQDFIANNTSYYYVMTTVNGNGESDPSAVASGTPRSSEQSPVSSIAMTLEINASPTSTITMTQDPNASPTSTINMVQT
jgi:hypothetical protein